MITKPIQLFVMQTAYFTEGFRREGVDVQCQGAQQTGQGGVIDSKSKLERGSAGFVARGFAPKWPAFP